MASLPTTQYAVSDGLSIAFQVFGEGQHDLLIVPGIISHVELAWESERHASFLRKLGENFRVIVFDKRGQGMSDRFDGAPSLEQRMDDLRVVMQSTGTERASILGLSEGGPMSMLFAATYPSAVERLILINTMARYDWAEDYPHRKPVKDRIETVAENWGGGFGTKRWAPSLADDQEFVNQMGRFERMSSTPTSIQSLMLANSRIDVRAILPELRTPTLLIQRRGDMSVAVGNGRYLADHIAGATYLEVPGIDHLPWVGDSDQITDAVSAFAASASHSSERTNDKRHVATALFTDIEDSTRKMAELGDQQWHELLDRHDDLAKTLVQEFRGQFIKSTGDGILAIFDGPTRAIHCAQRMVTEVERLGLRVRAGLHAGEVEHRANSDLTGLAVHTAARVMATAGAGHILVTQTLVDLTNGGEIEFESRGVFDLKGIPDPVRLFEPLSTANRT